MDLKHAFGINLRNKKKSYLQRVLKPLTHDFIELDDLIIGKKNGTWIAYERVCDHNGGVLFLDEGGKTATCPIHKWTLRLNEGRYENSCPKVPFKVSEAGDYLEVERYYYEFNDLLSMQLVDSRCDINFNAHASITVEIDGIKITSDPWFIGSCFATGWWHTNPPSEEAIERLRSSNFIYISHNHPDHLHIASLEKFVNQDTQFIVPNFESESVEKILRHHGFNNLIVTDFLKELYIESANGKFRLIIVKSGDDRDDSSLILETASNKILLGVDTNMPNKWVLPKVDMLFTAFASGASGFPSRIENFSRVQKEEIVKSNRASILHNHVNKLVSATKAKYVIPYAGYFTEANRDSDVKKINKKNTPEELVDYVESAFNGVVAINPLTSSHMSLYKDEFSAKVVNEVPSYFIDDQYVEDEILKFSGLGWQISDSYLIDLGKKFIASKFFDNLTVIFLPSDNSFENLVSKGLVIDFSLANRSYSLINFGDDDEENIAKISNPNKNNIELLKIRAGSLIGALNQGLPLEDLSIGFQIKMFRLPNIYNFNFWNHFTNYEFIKLQLD